MRKNFSVAAILQNADASDEWMFRVRGHARMREAHSGSERHACRRPLPASGARFML
jgi:hypothetical protein